MMIAPENPIEWERIVPSPTPGADAFRHLTQPLIAIRSVDGGRWHLSVSHRDRVPTWGEIGIARDALLPEEIHFMVPHPPRRYWINYNRKVLHLWEMRDRELITQFEWEGSQRKSNPPDSGDPE